MAEYVVTSPDGRKVRLTGSEPPTDAELDEIFASLPPKQAAIGLEGLAEAGATLASGIAAEPLAGLAGIGAALIPGGRTGGQAVADTREALTYSPRTQGGKAAVNSAGNFMAPLAGAMQSAERFTGDIGNEIAGPVGGAIGAAIPTAIGELLGVSGVRGAGRIAQAPIPAKAADIIKTGAQTGTRVLTSDVLPPSTFFGKFAQSLSEKLGPLGSGNARAAQQKSREAIIQGLADEFEIELDSDFASQMVSSVNKTVADNLKRAGEQRARAVTSLDTFGEVPVSRTTSEIDRQIARQKRLGEKADATLVANLERIKNSINGDFSLVKDIRTEVISDLRALNRSDDPRAAGAMQQVKSAIDQDMIEFARTNDRMAAKDWLESNRAFAHELEATKQTELKRILNSGNATPELVMPILRGGKRSELMRLKNSLGVNGRQNARAAIIQDALKDSGFFSGNINPDRFVTAMQRPSRIQARDVFFDAAADKQVDGLVRLLDATRRAQQASAAPATGIQTVPLLAGSGIGAGAMASPLGTVAVLGTLSAFAKAYESAPIRSLLLKLSNVQKGSKAETALLETAVPAFAAAVQSAKSEQQKQESSR